MPDAPLPPAPQDLLDPSGRPRLGAFAGALQRVGLERLARPGLAGRFEGAAQAKRWVYALVATDAALVGAAVVEAGWFGGAFVWAADLATGAVLAERSAAGLPRLQASVADRPAAGLAARWSGGGLRVELTRPADRYRLEIASAGLELEAWLDAAGAPPPFTLLAPVPGAGPRLTQKVGGLPVEGTLRAGGRSFTLAGGSGGVDFTAGLLARETDWRWAFGTGRAAGGAPVAFNLCEGFGLPPDAPGENALLRPGPARLPPVRFTFDRTAPLQPWTLEGERLRLVFTPAARHREVRELGLLSTRFTQVAGTFEGALPAPGGGVVAVAGLPGVVEDHRARW
ncbi:MAG: DUF2804 domain-containing protein [Anaeromyxobacter sp.]